MLEAMIRRLHVDVAGRHHAAKVVSREVLLYGMAGMTTTLPMTAAMLTELLGMNRPMLTIRTEHSCA